MTNILGAQQDASIVVIEQSPANIELLISEQPSVVEVITQGPQGPQGPAGVLDTSSTVDGGTFN